MRSLRSLCGIVLLLGLSSCLQVDNKILEKSYPQKQLYSLEAVRPPTPVGIRDGGKSLRIRPFQILPPFRGRSFVYRLDENRYESDFYNQFFADPSELLTGVAEKWFSTSGLFQRVSSVPSRLGADYFLEGTVGALYGDYRHPQAPQAVIELQLLLIASGQGDPEMIFSRSYSSSTPFAPDSPEALVTGWDQGFTHILEQVERDISTLGL